MGVPKKGKGSSKGKSGKGKDSKGNNVKRTSSSHQVLSQFPIVLARPDMQRQANRLELTVACVVLCLALLSPPSAEGLC